MPTLTLAVPEDLKKKMDSMPELNWSEIARKAISEKVKREVLLRKLDKMLEKSELTEEECLKLGEKVKAGMLKTYKAKGW